MALAYFITFTTYGTWLHGTDKGAGSVDRHHNVYGTPFISADHERERLAEEKMTGPPYRLREAARTLVRDAIVGLCQEKNWTLLALHVRTNHVHVVLSADRNPKRLRSDLKARASRELNRSGVDTNDKRWTRGGSGRHLFDEASIEAAVRYVLDEQGPPMAVYDPRIPSPEASGPKPPATNASPPPLVPAPLTPCASTPCADSQRAAHEVSASNPHATNAPQTLPPTSALISACGPHSVGGDDGGLKISGPNAYEE